MTFYENEKQGYEVEQEYEATFTYNRMEGCRDCYNGKAAASLGIQLSTKSS